jgi:hypothetical protein
VRQHTLIPLQCAARRLYSLFCSDMMCPSRPNREPLGISELLPVALPWGLWAVRTALSKQTVSRGALLSSLQHRHDTLTLNSACVRARLILFSCLFVCLFVCCCRVHGFRYGFQRSNQGTLVGVIELLSFEKDKQSWELEKDEKMKLSTLRKDQGNELFKVGEYERALLRCVHSQMTRHVGTLFSWL